MSRIEEMKKLVSLLKTVKLGDGAEFTYDGKQYRINSITFENDLLAALLIYHHFLFKQGFTGDVMFFSITPPMFKQPHEQEVLIVVKRFYGSNISQSLTSPSFDVVIDNYSVEGDNHTIALAVVGQSFANTLVKVAAAKDEEKIVDMVLAAGRLSKSLSKTLVPVVDLITGKILDLQPIGREDEIFHVLLTHFLRRSMVSGNEP